jgi:serpin B
MLLATPLAAAFALDPTMRRGITLVSQPESAAAGAAEAAIRGLSVDLYHGLTTADPRQTNLVFSPYSIMMALAMARAGARGLTGSEMDAVLHAPKPTPQSLDPSMNALNSHLRAICNEQSGDGAERPRLDAANSLWAQRGFAIEPNFLETLATYYGAGLNTVDFASAPESARQEINAWVSKRTNEKIPELLAKGVITPLTALVLANALYLRATWEFPFSLKSTKPDIFTTDSGKTLTVPMMTGPGAELGYLSRDDCFAVDLPYVGHQLAMAVIVPTRARLSEWEPRLTAGGLTQLLTGFSQVNARVRMPRWTFRLPADLGELLNQLGMVTAFTGSADFTGITSKTRLLISKVIHETFISVDEKGTEAASATAVIIDRTSLPMTLTIDRPFLYVIHDLAYGTPLFVGRVGDPSVTA